MVISMFDIIFEKWDYFSNICNYNPKLVKCSDEQLKMCIVDCHKSILHVPGYELSNIIKPFLQLEMTTYVT